jgi:hypothetical protein
MKTETILISGRGTYEYEYTPESLAALPACVATAVIEKKEREAQYRDMFPVWAQQLGALNFTEFVLTGTDDDGTTRWTYDVTCDGCYGSGTITSGSISGDCPCCDGRGVHPGGVVYIAADLSVIP